MAYIIGICGGSGAGKTFLANLLKEHYQNDLTIIPFDNYCKDRSYLSEKERSLINYDVPDSYDGDLLSSDLSTLKRGQSVEIPEFEFATHSRKITKKCISPTKIIIVEGIMCFSFPSVISQLDLKIYVDAQESVRYSRRLNRDINERGRTKESVYKQFYETVKPMHEIYIEPWKNKADYLIINNENNGLDISKLLQFINQNIK